MLSAVMRALGPLALLSGSLAATFAFFEFVVFAYVLQPDDVLRNVTIGDVVRYEPGAKATFRHPDGSSSHVTINAEGWNSTKVDYAVERKPETLRIAVVGDSYVHGAYVEVEQGYPEVLERTLGARGIKNEVYRFGMDGAPLSQYLHMLRKEVVRYRPDLVVVGLIHNDFDESFRFMGTRYNSSFMKVGGFAAGKPREIAPKPFEAGWPDRLRELRTFRYLYYETNAYLALKQLTSSLIWGEGEQFSEEFVSSAVDVRNISDLEQIRFTTRYVMDEIVELAKANKFRVLFVMDGVREAVYAGRESTSYAVASLNAIAEGTAKQVGAPFLDLQSALESDYARHGEHFEFDFDWHWNAYANNLVGITIADYLEHHPRLLGLDRPVRLTQAVQP